MRVKRKAWHFGEEWAKQTFGKDWTTALVHGRTLCDTPRGVSQSALARASPMTGNDMTDKFLQKHAPNLDTHY